MKNEIIKLKIEDIDKDGQGIAKNDNKVYFVKDGLICDEVEAGITKESKNFNYAKVLKYIINLNFDQKVNAQYVELVVASKFLNLIMINKLN